MLIIFSQTKIVNRLAKCSINKNILQNCTFSLIERNYLSLMLFKMLNFAISKDLGC